MGVAGTTAGTHVNKKLLYRKFQTYAHADRMISPRYLLARLLNCKFMADFVSSMLLIYLPPSVHWDYLKANPRDVPFFSRRHKQITP